MPLFPTVPNAFIDVIGTILLSQCHLIWRASQSQQICPTASLLQDFFCNIPEKYHVNIDINKKLSPTSGTVSRCGREIFLCLITVLNQKKKRKEKDLEKKNLI